MTLRHRRIALAGLAAVAAGGAMVPRAARACGGFFCNPPQQPGGDPPIAQAAENVIFALDRDPITGRGLVEAHVQIVYTGAADQFSWVVPVTAVPEVGVGSDLAFQILEPRTRPTFRVQWQFEGTCQGQGNDGCAGCASAGGAAGDSRGPGMEPPPVEVAFRGNVGPYATAVIRSDDPAALEAWLVENSYFVSPEASQIIRGYVDSGSYFVALRLQAGRDVSEIQPVVLRLGAEEGCLPLKLTAIAATPNLRANVWVLGAGRAVPINYTEVTLNLARLDWFNRGTNYDVLVSDAVNEAGGNAFLTEYAQPASLSVPWFTVPVNIEMQVAASRNQLQLWNAVLASGLPLTGQVVTFLRKYVPVPPAVTASGVTDAQFYGNPGVYQRMITGDAVNGGAAAEEFRQKILVPLETIRLLFLNHSTLTRLATFISPEEMTKDPLFVTNRTLPAVWNQHMVTARVRCGDEDYDVCHAPVALNMESGETVMFRSVAGDTCNLSQMPPYDRAQLDAMPAADHGWRRDPEGDGDVVLDNTSAITAAVKMHNAAADPDAGGCSFVARTVRRPWLALSLVGVWLALALRRRRRPARAPGGRAG